MTLWDRRTAQPLPADRCPVVRFLTLAVQKLRKLQSEEKNFLRSPKINRAHKIVIAWLRSGEIFVLSIFIAAMLLHGQDPHATLAYRRQMLSPQRFTSGEYHCQTAGRSELWLKSTRIRLAALTK